MALEKEVSTVSPVSEHGLEQGEPSALTAKEWGELDDVAKEGFTQNDQRDMQRMGKSQQFRRNFKLITTIGFTTCVMGTWEILLTANTQGLVAGGLSGLFWSLCWAYIGQFFIVLSLAEMAAMAPTAGGQYHWVSEFAPRSSQRFLSYCSGWLSAISWQSIIALDSYLVGVIIQSLIVINNDSYVPKRWQATLLIWASVIGMGMFNVVAAKRLHLIEGFFAILHVLAFFPIIIVLLVMTTPKQTGSEVFTSFTDNGAGWPNTGLATLVGQVSCLFVVLGSDSVAHMAEEVSEASITVPRAMIWSYLLNVPFTFGLLLTYLFCIGNVSDAVSSPTGFPFIYVFQNATNSVSSTTGMTVVILILLVIITISAMASTARQSFAFARDHGLPFSTWLSKVDTRFHIPVNSVIFTCLFTMVISLINIGSTVAFNAMLSLSTVALMATYLVSIGCVTLKRIRGEALPQSRWTLGRAGMPVNVIALVYAVWAFFWSFWPNAHDINATNFNWACVLFVGLMLISAVLYVTYARGKYEGPVVKCRFD
ncbi:putative amino acid transporter [Rhizodiscina lignyota]|uniref:Amino acid transporter n=1 Tax=Rhizodiscina lignyota TaxID=1504668 RepID=A0A9P4IAX9_9PEZI|nr:putative amino acid transporter [Rhizodiscina lignyota]